MFNTIGNTMDLMAASWRVLAKHKSLMLFPVMSGAGVLVLALMAAGVVFGIGGGNASRELNIFFGFVVYLVASFIVIFFNSALVAAADEALEGGSPTVGSGLNAAYDHLDSILGWALFSATIGLALQWLRDSDNLVVKIIGWVLEGIWGYMIYLVVPALVLEGLGPIEAAKRSTELLTKTWGKQVVGNFGFGLGYLAVVVAAVLLVLLGLMFSPALAIVIGLFVALPGLAVGFAGLLAMEGIFKTALYRYAETGAASGHFPPSMLRGAYVEKKQRGRWDSAYASPQDEDEGWRPYR